MSRARILAAAALAASFAFTGAVFAPAKAATLIQDGNFNDPLVAGNFTTLTGGSFFGTGNVWQVTGASVDVIGDYWVPPTTGGGSVDLDGNAPGGISQAFTAGAGTYQLSFYLSANPDGGLFTTNVEVKIGDLDTVIPYTVTAANSRGDMQYDLETLIFHTGGGGALSFASLDTDSPFGPVIGGVSIASVPEPQIWTMLILGFGGIGMMLRTSTRRQATLVS
jgi:hypothetical protein